MEAIHYFTIGLFILNLVSYGVGRNHGYKNGFDSGYDSKAKEQIAENKFLTEENQRLQESLGFWSKIGSGNLNLYNNIVQSHNANLNSTLQAVISLLQNVKQDGNSSLSQDDRSKIDQMIQRARELS